MGGKESRLNRRIMELEGGYKAKAGTQIFLGLWVLLLQAAKREQHVLVLFENTIIGRSNMDHNVVFRGADWSAKP